MTASVFSGTAQATRASPFAGVTARLERALELRGKGVRLLEAEACHQTVAEYDYA
jgi:hypothetical protein